MIIQVKKRESIKMYNRLREIARGLMTRTEWNRLSEPFGFVPPGTCHEDVLAAAIGELFDEFGWTIRKK